MALRFVKKAKNYFNKVSAKTKAAVVEVSHNISKSLKHLKRIESI